MTFGLSVRSKAEGEMARMIDDTMMDVDIDIGQKSTSDYYKIKMLYMIAKELHGINQELGILNEDNLRREESALDNHN